MNPDTRKSEDASATALTAMREPPGRLGDIVRRLKQAQPSPQRLAPVMASASDAPGK
jgi:hypothetical protein